MNNIYTTKEEVENVKEACRISVSILKELKKLVVLGNTPNQINQLAEDLCLQYKVLPSFKGVAGTKVNFPGACCVCVNEETLHAIPFSDREFQSGDIVKVDFGVIYKGIHTDHCVTVGLGELSKDERRLIETTKLAVDTAIKQAYAGNRVGDISNALSTISHMAGFDYIRGYAGHGIGPSLWEDPSIPYHGEKGTGPELKEGLLICIELQLSLGGGKLSLDKDGWTLRTSDMTKTAMFEHVVLVQKQKPLVLTRLD